MNNEEVEDVLNIILDSIISSNLSNYTKVEVLLNLKQFFKNYDENIKLLRNNEKRL